MDGRGRARARRLRDGRGALRRFLTPAYTLPKVIENYQTRFSVSYPNEEKPAARPLRTTPMYDVFDAMGAVWGQQYGLEVANYFAEPGEPRYETPSFRRSNAWEATAREVAAVREGVGINEVQNFGKYTVQGRMRAPGSTGSWRAACRSRGACRCRPCWRRRGGSWGISPSPALARTTSA
jgi:hypothetical protein